MASRSHRGGVRPTSSLSSLPPFKAQGPRSEGPGGLPAPSPKEDSHLAA